MEDGYLHMPFYKMLQQKKKLQALVQYFGFQLQFLDSYLHVFQ